MSFIFTLPPPKAGMNVFSGRERIIEMFVSFSFSAHSEIKINENSR